jgi:hypothetical protein
MVSGIPPVGITQNERFLSCDIVLGVQHALWGFQLCTVMPEDFENGRSMWHVVLNVINLFMFDDSIHIINSCHCSCERDLSVN